jgi:hypothetical protein
MKILVSIIILIVASIFWQGLQSEGVNLTVGSETSTNLSGTDLIGVNLTEVILDGGLSVTVLFLMERSIT